jgi:type IV pilus assembly protein PilX
MTTRIFPAPAFAATSSPSRQRGAVLLVCLILLVVMTLVGVSTMESSNLEHKMVANMSDRQVCFEAAERAAKIGEDWLKTQNAAPLSSTTGSGSTPVYQDLAAGWWDTESNFSGWSHQSVTAASQEAQAPAYVIEDLVAGRKLDSLNSQEAGDTNTGVSFYRVTSLGYGQRDTNKCIVEITVARRF